MVTRRPRRSGRNRRYVPIRSGHARPDPLFAASPARAMLAAMPSAIAAAHGRAGSAVTHEMPGCRLSCLASECGVDTGQGPVVPGESVVPGLSGYGGVTRHAGLPFQCSGDTRRSRWSVGNFIGTDTTSSAQVIRTAAACLRRPTLSRHVHAGTLNRHVHCFLLGRLLPSAVFKALRFSQKFVGSDNS